MSISGFTPSELGTVEVEEDLKISGDQAKDKDGNDFVKHNDKWVKVPEGNSIPFYKKYLELGGKYEE